MHAKGIARARVCVKGELVTGGKGVEREKEWIAPSVRGLSHGNAVKRGEGFTLADVSAKARFTLSASRGG